MLEGDLHDQDLLRTFHQNCVSHSCAVSFFSFLALNSGFFQIKSKNFIIKWKHIWYVFLVLFAMTAVLHVFLILLKKQDWCSIVSSVIFNFIFPHLCLVWYWCIHLIIFLRCLLTSQEVSKNYSDVHVLSPHREYIRLLFNINAELGKHCTPSSLITIQLMYYFLPMWDYFHLSH